MVRPIILGLTFLVAYPASLHAQITTAGQERAELLSARALLDAQAGKTDDAIGHLRQAVVNDPQNVDAWMFLGQLALDAERYAEAAEAFGHVRELAPDRPGLNFLLGRVFFHAGDTTEALTALDSALVEDPENATAHLYRGLTLMRLRQADEAVDAVQRAVELDPQLAGTAELLSALALMKKGDWAGAERALDAALEEEGGVALGKLADRLRDEVAERRRQERRLRFHLTVGTEWDTNVQLVESEVITNSDSFVTSGEVGLELRHKFGPKMLVSMGGLFQETYPHEVGDVDIHGAVGYLYTGFKMGPFTLLPQYLFGYYRLNNDSFLQVNSIRPMFVWSTFLGPMRGYYDFQLRHFFPTLEKGREGELHALGVVQRFSLGKLTRWFELGYRYERDQTDDPDFLRQFHTIDGRFAWDLPWSLSLLARSTYTFRDYVETHSDFGVERDEERQRYKVMVRRYFNENFSLGVGYAYLNTDSNISLFDTDRSRYIMEVGFEY